MIDTRSEYEHQRAVFEWRDHAKQKYPELKLLNGSINGVRLPVGVAVKMRLSGMPRGYPDLFLPVRRLKPGAPKDSRSIDDWYNGLYIELKALVHGRKRLKKPRIGDDQVEWLTALGEQGYATFGVWGSDAAIGLILEYLNSGRF